MDGQENGGLESQTEYNKDSVYWALWQGKDLTAALSDKERQFFETARTRGLLKLWVIAYAAYHGVTPQDLRDTATQQIGFEGDELENLRFHLNFSRSYTRRAAIMALGEKPAFKAMVVNTDHQSQARAELSDKVVNSLYERYSEKHDMKVSEADAFVGSGATHYRWDFRGGDAVKVQEPIPGQFMPDGSPALATTRKKSGAPVVGTVYPWCVVKETRKTTSGDLWRIVRETESKWNLAATFPAMRDAILAQGTTFDVYDFAQLFRLYDLDMANGDLCVVKHFYHQRCDAVPEGRYTITLGDLVLWDGPCPTKEGVPVAEMTSAEWIETTFGYCDGWDMLAICQGLNQVNSDELTNYANYGKQSIAYEKGTNVTDEGLTMGTSYEVPPGSKMPQAIQLVAIPATLPALKQYLHAQLDLTSGQSSTTRGEPDANIRSGEMAALLDSVSIRYQSFRQQSARQFRIRGANIILDMIDRYGETPFLVEIAGVSNRSFVQEFTRDDLSGVQRVTMDIVSPLMQTVAGRLDLYMKLKDLPQDQRSAAYELIITGDASLFAASDRSSEMLIQRENEDLVTGHRQVVAIAGEDASLHYRRHWAQLERLLASDNQDQDALGRIYAHLDETVQTWLGSSPVVAALRQLPSPPALGPSVSNPAGNPTYQTNMLLLAGQSPPMTAGAPMDAEGGKASGSAGTPTGASQGSAAQVNDQGGPSQVHPSGTNLPQPSTPPGQ